MPDVGEKEVFEGIRALLLWLGSALLTKGGVDAIREDAEEAVWGIL